MTINVSGLAGGGGIKSIQSGFHTHNGVAVSNVTLSPVDVAKSFVTVSGSAISTTDPRCFVVVDLTSPTNLRFSRFISTGNAYIAWHVIEYN